MPSGAGTGCAWSCSSRSTPGCLLVFSHSLGGGGLGRLAAGRDAAGWDVCLDTLQARLAGDTVKHPTDWLGPMERYIQQFGLDSGDIRATPDGWAVHFARDLVWKPAEQVWALLTEGTEPQPGAEPPQRRPTATSKPGR